VEKANHENPIIQRKINADGTKKDKSASIWGKEPLLNQINKLKN
jgi:hypothetical protein